MGDEEALLNSYSETTRPHWFGVTVGTGGAGVDPPPQRCEVTVSEVGVGVRRGSNREVKALQVSRRLGF